jgi:hypothetical protein
MVNLRYAEETKVSVRMSRPIPPAQEDFDVHTHAEVLDVARYSLPLNNSFIQRILNVICFAEVHPMNEEMKGSRIWNREE